MEAYQGTRHVKNQDSRRDITTGMGYEKSSQTTIALIGQSACCTILLHMIAIAGYGGTRYVS